MVPAMLWIVLGTVAQAVGCVALVLWLRETDRPLDRGRPLQSGSDGAWI